MNVRVATKIKSPLWARSRPNRYDVAIAKARATRRHRTDEVYFGCSQTPTHSWPKAKAIGVVAMWLQRRPGTEVTRRQP